MNRITVSILVAASLIACSGGGSSPSSSGGALHVTTTALPGGQVNVAYTASLSASGGTSPYQWAITSGSLPTGLSLTASGAISGTPTAAGTSSFVVTATDSATTAATASATLSITIQPAGSSASPLRVATTSLPGATVGAAYSAQLTSSGGTAPVSWALGAGTSLPPGLGLSSAGAISGTPSTAGSYAFTVVAVDSSSPQQTASAALSITVTSTTGTLAVSTTNLPQGTVGTSYSQQLDATGGTTPYTWSLATGTLPTGLSLSAGGLLAGTPMTSGSFTFTVQVSDSSATSQVAEATFTVTINPNPSQSVAITTGSLAAGTVGHAYQAQLQAAGGVTPYSWAITAGSLPNGLTLSTTSGSISGTPTAAGSFTFTVEVADASTPALTASKQFTITIAPPPGQSLSITSTTLPAGTVGTTYHATVTASGGTPPYTFSAVSGSMPPGLTLASDGTISGIPTTSGMFTFTVRVTDSASQTADASLSIFVSPAPGQLTITTWVLPVAHPGSPYTATLAAANGTPPYTWSLTAGALPAGLTLYSDTGVISGTPTETGTFTFTVKVVDSSATPQTASHQLYLVVR